MPSVQRAHEAFQETDAVVLTISLDGGGMKTVESYIAKHRYTIPTLLDAKMEVARAFGVRGVPATFIIDRQGTVVAHGHGPVDFDQPEFRQYIHALLAQPQE